MAIRENVEVKIYGSSYKVRCDGGVLELKRIAKYVDEKMRETAAARPRLSALRVAVLSLLRVSDDLFTARLSGKTQKVFSGDVQSRLSAMSKELDEVLRG